MVMRQPFIVFAAPGTLRYLRDYGFRTFNDIWDESYDEEIDHSARQEKILRLIKNLSRLPVNEFKKILDKCQSVIDYNQQYFFSQQFEDRLLGELHQNIRNSILEATEKSAEFPGGIFFQTIDSAFQQNEKIPPNEMKKLSQVLPVLQTTQEKRYYQISRQYPWIKSLA